jgi:predicted SprT family Zn-dependent metalloprotease
MDPLNAYRLAVTELGDVPAERLTAHIAHRYGLRVEPRFIPIFRASLRDLEGLPAAPVLVKTAAPAISTGSGRFREVRQLALDLLARHGLTDWQFDYNRRKQAMGLCVYRRRAIELSIHFVERNESDEILDTLLHEIAHALVGPGHGHDRVWKKKCLEVGARPQRCGRADMPPGRWQGCCGQCGKRFDRHRKPKRLRGWFCKTCGPVNGKFAWIGVES